MDDDLVVSIKHGHVTNAFGPCEKPIYAINISDEARDKTRNEIVQKYEHMVETLKQAELQLARMDCAKANLEMWIGRNPGDSAAQWRLTCVPTSWTSQLELC